MFRSLYVCGPAGQEETGLSIPLLPELEQSYTALVGTLDLGMEGIRRAMLASDALDDCAPGTEPFPCPLRHDPSLHYETDSLQLSDTADLCRLSQLKLQSTSDPILHDRHLGDDLGEADAMYTELTGHYRDFSPGSTGDCSMEPELSDSSSSESGLESPGSVVQWDPIAECAGVPISMDPDGPLPPVSDIFAHRLHKEDYGEGPPYRSLPLLIKTERADSEEDDSLDSLSSPHHHAPASLSTTTATATTNTTTTTNNNSNHLARKQAPNSLLSYTTLQPHYHRLPPSTTAPAGAMEPPAPTSTTTSTTTTNNSNYHDYTRTPGEAEEGMREGEWRDEGSRRAGPPPHPHPHPLLHHHHHHHNHHHHYQHHHQHHHHHGGGGGDDDNNNNPREGEGEKGQRKKPGRKKGQVSKVLHLWEFIRDLLGDPNYCPRIISWENEREGVFRVLHSSEVARLWGEKKKNKKTMTYEKLSRSLRYSRKEGYFDALPRDRGYPKKLCFKFGPKSHGWRD